MSSSMPDQIFENLRLAAIYDRFDGKRDDLAHYFAIAKELRAKSIVDIGCGTGTFACLLSQLDYEVTGLDPASASIDIAQNKEGAGRVHWLRGTAEKLPSAKFDLAVMTGNVAQVFLTDEEWGLTLASTKQSLKPEGHLVFEVRNPAKKAWLNWTKEKTYCRMRIPHEGYVEAWCEVTEKQRELVSFRWTYTFGSDGKVLTSDSTLRFWEKDAIVASLENAGYDVKAIRDAPDRPEKELVFIARYN